MPRENVRSKSGTRTPRCERVGFTGRESCAGAGKKSTERQIRSARIGFGQTLEPSGELAVSDFAITGVESDGFIFAVDLFETVIAVVDLMPVEVWGDVLEGLAWWSCKKHRG